MRYSEGETGTLVFERFEKLNEYAQGTGLGLSICKLIVSKWKGAIWIDPDYTGGARFVFLASSKNRKRMKRITLIYAWLLLSSTLSVAAQEKVVKLKIVQTSDVHGNYYPYNFITRQEWKGSLGPDILICTEGAPGV